MIIGVVTFDFVSIFIIKNKNFYPLLPLGMKQEGNLILKKKNCTHFQCGQTFHDENRIFLLLLLLFSYFGKDSLVEYEAQILCF